MELYLIRHGESTYNRDDKVQGQKNSHLTPYGKAQAQLLKNRLSNISFDFVYSSPLKRVYDTAKISLDGRYIIKLDKRICEISLGEWEGKRAKTLFKESKAFRDWLARPDRIVPKNGESLIAFKNRVVSFFDEIIELEKEKGRGIIFTHSGVISILLIHLLKISIDKVWSIPTSYCSITILEITPSILLKIFNDTCHLIPS